MKKIVLCCFAVLLPLFASCGEKTIPVYADVEDFAASLYARAGIEKSGIYREELEESSAFAFGLSRDEFDEYVDHAVCYRQLVDNKGQTLYLFETEAAGDSLSLAQKIYAKYEFPPCDAAEKMTVACSGRYVMLFKSTASEVDAAAEGFRTLSGGALRFRKDKNNGG
ncbi:MAG: hypothetical protein IJW87_06090 [Clostridia bacterium]|nr:hypothetical protein [Clostridia bacterium]